eukprot:scaffold153837_cov36-Tisochrysis_lutea.AAC.3
MSGRPMVSVRLNGRVVCRRADKRYRRNFVMTPRYGPSSARAFHFFWEIDRQSAIPYAQYDGAPSHDPFVDGCVGCAADYR